MLTFFRRIRKELLQGGRLLRYLLYAIGEIALVVIGILIALQVNNWNQWKKDRITENDLLKQDIINLYEDTYVALKSRQVWGLEFRPDLDNKIIEHFSWDTKTTERTPRDYQSFIKNNYFIALIEIAALQRRYISQSVNASLRESQRVLQLIKDELGENDE